MVKKNMGQIDRTVRFIVGVSLISIGLLLGGLSGILVATFALLPIVTSLTGFCPGYIPFGISTLGREQNS